MVITEPDNYIISNIEEEFDFTNIAYDLQEPPIPTITGDFFTPIQILNDKLKPFKNNLTCFHINACSIPYNYDEIVRLMTETGVDILGVSETFICEKTPKIFYEVPGYKFVHRDRNMKCRGGVGLYIRDGIDFKEIKLCRELVQPEICFIEVTLQNMKIAIGVIYKSPLISYTDYAVLLEILHPIVTKYDHQIILGDFNIDQLKPDSSACKFFRENVIEPFDFRQMITEPTRITEISATLIDLILVSYPENVKTVGVIDIPAISDHCLIFVSYAVKKPKFKAKIIIKRKMENFDIEQFKNDISIAPWGNLAVFDDDDLDNKVTVMENIYNEIMDKHCPKIEMRVTHPSASAWRTEEIKELQNERDRYYSKYKSMKKSKKRK